MPKSVMESEGVQLAEPGVEHVLAAPTTDEHRFIVLDTGELTGSEQVELRIKVPILGRQRVLVEKTYGASDNPMVLSPLFAMPDGGEFTLKQIGGTGRSFPWRIDIVIFERPVLAPVTTKKPHPRP